MEEIQLFMLSISSLRPKGPCMAPKHCRLLSENQMLISLNYLYPIPPAPRSQCTVGTRHWRQWPVEECGHCAILWATRGLRWSA